MTPNFKISKNKICIIALLFYCFSGFSQVDTSTVKAQFALGVNQPSTDGFVSNFQPKSINFPTVNLGVQYMFKPFLGAKLDFGFNRFSNLKDTPTFKINYSRINGQLVFNVGKLVSLPSRFGIFTHAGPGFSMVKPLGIYTQNKISYLNAMGGIEIHYGVSDKLSVYTDVSYIHGFAKKFNPEFNGFGSFNGNLLTITIGASISLSGCYYCQ